MLQPREADVPVLFLVFVLLPLVTYILLGIWNETAKKKARISVLAQRAAEEALRIEEMASADVISVTPSLSTGYYECARCFAPATTRCSRCKSVRYCSGKCQIIHWRQGHKQECQQWQDNHLYLSAGQSVTGEAQWKPILDNLTQELLDSGFPGDLSVDPPVATTDAYQDLAGGKPRVLVKLKRAAFKNGDSFPSAFDGTVGCGMEARALHTGPLFSELSSKDAPSGHKCGTGNFKPDDEIHRNQSASNSSTIRNVRQQFHKLTGETRNALKPSNFPGISTTSHLDKNVTNEREIDMNMTSEKVDSFEGGLSTASETLDSACPGENISVKGSIVYKKPPYTLGHTASLSQKSTDKVSSEYPSQGAQGNTYMENESRVPQTNVSATMSSRGCNGISSMAGMKMAGSKKSSKVLKRNLMGLINDNKKNKIPQLLFPYEDIVKFFQCEVWGISPRGLLNCGNSCYANAVLQCLTCTKPLMVYLLRRLHSRTCWTKDWCLMCELEQHVALLREDGGPLSPSRILSNMRNIGCRMGGGSQEDAHEFLRLLVMSMQSTCLEGLGGENEVDPRLQETTLIQQMFGGRLQSKVKCLRCHLESERYENIMDLTLEIHGWVESLEDALTQFTAPEDLDGENKYRCGRCAAYVRARKQLSVHEVPNILTIVLKRFQTGKYGKINKCVTFPDMLDMIPFVTGSADKPPLYMLYAVVVHLDTLNASFSGHYVSYVKDLQGTWFRIDDSEVQAVPLSQVMSEGAYMLFYSRSYPRPPRAYIDQAPLLAPTSTKLTSSKTQKPLKHGQDKQTDTLFATEESGQLRYDFRTVNREGMRDQTNDYILRSTSRNVLPADETFSMDFSDATSSDWSLFTSSDESSFTTESTRDSFSTVDYGDNAGLDPISSLFSSFYAPEYSNSSSSISCTRLSPSRPQTRFFSESRARVLDSSMLAQPSGNVYRGRKLGEVRASPTEPSSLGCGSGLYGRHGTNPKDSLVQTSGFCDL